ncbi:MAG: pyridoxal phosphate-dependent aminotransferase [Candidatus Brocadiae bacterium]|nr:pyridoxal phosphate-dependent aminotransferase [Candidatus Brocadiia bacterium]
MKIRKELDLITPSLTLVLKSKVDEMRKQGIDVVSFTVGEPDFHTPVVIKKEGIKAIEENFTKYTDGAGIPELRKAIVEKFRKENGIEYTPENIVVGNGGKQVISSAIHALTEPGDEVIIPTPYWLSYPAMAILANAKPVFLETKAENDYRVTPEDLKKAITPKTSLLLLNSPSNPTGGVYHKEHLEALLPIIQESKIAVISDEIYEKLLYDGLPFVSMGQYPQIKEQLVVVNGVSKSFAMTGWRIGYAAAPLKVAKAMIKIESHLTGNACSVSQKAAWKAIQNNLEDQTELKRMQTAFQKRRDLGYELICKIPGLRCTLPQGAFYLFPDASSFYGKSYETRKIQNSKDLCEYLLEVCHVSVVPGLDFGNDRCFRISFATSEEEIRKGMQRIQTGLERLK